MALKLNKKRQDCNFKYLKKGDNLRQKDYKLLINRFIRKKL